MHEDGTEHDWVPAMVMEQGTWLVAGTLCRGCTLTAWDLFMDRYRELREKAEKPVEVTASTQDLAVQHMNLLFSGVAFDLDRRVEG